MAIHPDVVWQDRHGRGAVKVDQVGLRVVANGHWSPDLTDTAELTKIYHALGDLIMLKNGERADGEAR